MNSSRYNSSPRKKRKEKEKKKKLISATTIHRKEGSGRQRISTTML